MVVFIQQNLILNSDNVCYAKIVADEESGYTNKMQIALVGGENIEVEFSNVEVAKSVSNTLPRLSMGALCILTLTGKVKRNSLTRACV